VVLCLVGAVFVAQGAGVIHGSVMSGHHQFSVLGAVVIVVGFALLLWARHARTSRIKR